MPIRVKRLLRKSSRPTESIWALKDVGFEVARGEVIGVIGSNGAEKALCSRFFPDRPNQLRAMPRYVGESDHCWKLEPVFTLS